MVFLRFVSFILASIPALVCGQELRASGTIRTGMEWDDNVLRRDGEDRISDFLARYFTTLGVTSRSMGQGVTLLDVSHGGKFFVTEGDSDELLTEVYLGHQQRFSPWFSVFAHLDMKDRTERVSTRDYNRGGIGGGIELGFGPVTVRSGAAARYFAFKPSPDASSSSSEGNLRLRWAVIPQVQVGVGYTIAARYFDTKRFILDSNGVIVDPKTTREDRFHVLQATASWRGPVVLEGGYSLSINESNSYGQELTRQSAEIMATAPLPWNFFASLKLELQRTTYGDPVLIDADFLLDEDNRNSLVSSLAWTFGESWEIEVRYSVYLQEFGVGSDYRRQTVMVAMGYLFD